MRLRFQTVSPLPELKAWYSTDPDAVSDGGSSTIAHLKHTICLQIPALRQFGVNGRQLVLLLDSFELLDDSPLSVVRDGDLICIEIRPSVQPLLFRKRKAAHDEGVEQFI